MGAAGQQQPDIQCLGRIRQRLYAFYISGPWNIAEFKKRIPAQRQDEWMTMPLPGPNGPGASIAGGSEALDQERIRDVRRLLYGLDAVLQLHFAQEEELYATMLDSQHVTDTGKAAAGAA